METVLIVLACLFILPVVAGWLLKRRIEIVENRVINTAPQLVWNRLQDLTTWQEWSAWSTYNDASLEVYFGPKTSGTGASMDWKGKKLGTGNMRIISLNKNKEVTVESGFHKGKFIISHSIATHPNGSDTLVVWKASVTTKWSSVGRLLGRLLMRKLRRDIAVSLQLLEQVCR